jgi:hypothetical protein
VKQRTVSRDSKFPSRDTKPRLPQVRKSANHQTVAIDGGGDDDDDDDAAVGVP